MAAMEEDPPNQYVLDLADMLFSPQRRARVHRMIALTSISLAIETNLLSLKGRLSKLLKYKEKVPEDQAKDLFDPVS